MAEVFNIKNVSTNNIEIKEFGLVLVPNQIVDLGNHDKAFLSSEVSTNLLSGNFQRIIADISVSYDWAYAYDKNFKITGNASIGTNLQLDGSALVKGNFSLFRDASIGSSLYVHGAGGATIDSSVYIGGNLRIIFDTSIGRNLRVDASISIGGKSYLFGDVSIGSGLFVHGAGGAIIDSSLRVLGDVSIGKTLRIGNDSSIGNNLPYLQLDVSNGKKIVTAGNYYGQEYQLAQDLTATSTSATTPQTKVTMTTTNLPLGTYKIVVHWMWRRDSASNSARFDVSSGTSWGTTTMMEMEAGDTTDFRPETRIFYRSLSGVNIITFNYWGESGVNSTTVSDATIELIRVK